MRPRSAARRLALDVLYEAEIRDVLPHDALELRKNEGWVLEGTGDEAADRPLDDPSDEVLDYVRALVDGVQRHQAEIDQMIASYADRWALERMPIVDRNVVRIALFELLWSDDVPVAVAINEAVELVKSLSTDDSGRFVNGLLGRIAQTRDPEAR